MISEKDNIKNHVLCIYTYFGHREREGERERIIHGLEGEENKRHEITQ